MKTEREINHLIGEIMDRVEDPRKRKFTGMTYEEGLRNALEWALDEGGAHPFEEE